MGFIYVDAGGGGLVNRLNCILNGIIAHHYTKRKIFVYWNDKHSSFQCALTEIYRAGDPSVLEIKEEIQFPEEDRYVLCDWPNDPLNAKLENSFNYAASTPEQFKTFCTSLPDSTHLIIRSPNTFLFDIPISVLLDEYHKLLVLRDDFKVLIQTFLQNNTFNTGIHLRLTEKIIINGYNMGMLNNDIQHILQQYPDRHFLICSDDHQVEDELIKVVPNSCHYPKVAALEKTIEDKPFIWFDSTKDYGYCENLIRGKQYSYDGFVDLYLLGCCNTIIGINTGGSTYNLLANWFAQNSIREKLFS
jgi:hypothetical protein